ncbi:hypothetical protein [Treponema lecithinolyticum]
MEVLCFEKLHNNAAAKPFVFGLEQRFIRLPFSRSPLGSIKNKKNAILLQLLY